MKKQITLIILSLFFISTISFSQITQGTKVISGHLLVNPLKLTSEYKDAIDGITKESISLTLFSIMPKVSYAIQENLTVGAGIGYIYIRAKDDENIFDAKINMLTLYPYMRYYKTPLAHAGFFLEAGLGISFGGAKINLDEDEEDVDEPKTSLVLFNLGIKPGFYIKITNSLVFEATIGGLSFTSGVTKDKNDENNKLKITNFNLSINPGITFGFALHLSK